MGPNPGLLQALAPRARLLHPMELRDDTIALAEEDPVRFIFPVLTFPVAIITIAVPAPEPDE